MEILDRYQDALRPDWLVFVLLALLVLLALVGVFGRERLLVIARSVTRPRVPRQEVREMMDVLDIGYLGFWSILILSIGLFTYQQLVICGDHPFSYSPFQNYLMICAAIASYFVLKYLFIRVSMFVLGEEFGGTEYYYNTFMLFSIAGVALIPLIIFSAYVQWVPSFILWVGIAILVITIFYQWARGWIIAMGNGGRLGYIFLYFCVLEILPFALLARVIYDAATVL